MASLANASKQPALTLAARRMQVLAILRIKKALADLLEVKLDNTLAAVIGYSSMIIPIPDLLRR